MRRLELLFLLSAAFLWAQPAPTNISPEAIRADERDRDTREKLQEVVAALGLKTGSVVADIGARYGYFAVRLSKTVGPAGAVYAEEIDAGLVKKLAARVRAERLNNVKSVIGTPADPHLPVGGVDAVLMADVYQEVQNPAALLSAIGAALRPAGSLMIIDYLKSGSRGKSRAEMAREHTIAPEMAEKDLQTAGFHITAQRKLCAWIRWRAHVVHRRP